MSKNLCPGNNISFDNSQTVRFDTPIPAGEYTVSAIVESTDTDSSNCLLLFYYPDNATLEVYIGRSPVDSTERVFKTFNLAQDATKVRIYAGEGHNPSVGDTATFTNLMIEAGNQMTDYVPYGEEEPSPEPEPEPDVTYEEYEVIAYYSVLAGLRDVSTLMMPTCRETHLLRKLLDPNYEVSFTSVQSRTEMYLWDLIKGTTYGLNNIPKSDKEKYLHIAIGGTVDEMPNPGVCELNHWMYQWLKKLGKVE